MAAPAFARGAALRARPERRADARQRGGMRPDPRRSVPAGQLLRRRLVHLPARV